MSFKCVNTLHAWILSRFLSAFLVENAKTYCHYRHSTQVFSFLNSLCNSGNKPLSIRQFLFTVIYIYMFWSAENSQSFNDYEHVRKQSPCYIHIHAQTSAIASYPVSTASFFFCMLEKKPPKKAGSGDWVRG